MKIKICGLCSERDIGYVNETMPDYIGFVFAESRRRVSFDTARVLRAGLNPGIRAVGVFCDERIEAIQEALDRNIIDIVQLHGHEDCDYIKKIRVPVIKAVRIGEPVPMEADFLLFDSNQAGSGRKFDWTRIPRTETPFFIAGGINPSNIEEAVKLGCYGVDISSGAESGGVKDKNKILELVRRVRDV